jgi:cold shock CspA family protein
MTVDVRLTGAVKFFKREQGCGFMFDAEPDAPDVLVHVSAIEDGQPLERGERVAHEVEETPDGRLRAARVRRVESRCRQRL